MIVSLSSSGRWDQAPEIAEGIHFVMQANIKLSTIVFPGLSGAPLTGFSNAVFH